MRALTFLSAAIATAFAILFGAAVMAALFTMLGTAFAHTAPSGWSYDSSCCSTTDCRQVPASWVRETGEGYLLVKTREMLRHGDKRIKVSPDGLWHWCTTAGRDDAGTICLYVPPRGDVMIRSSDFEQRETELDKSIDAIAQQHVEDGSDWRRHFHANHGRFWAGIPRLGDDRRWQNARAA